MYALFKNNKQMTAGYETKKKLIKGIMLYCSDEHLEAEGIYMVNKLYKIKEVREVR